jgi:hypothetical protein
MAQGGRFPFRRCGATFQSRKRDARSAQETRMPHDERKFRNAPLCALSKLTVVVPDGVGVWLTVDEEHNRGNLSDEDLMTRCHALSAQENGRGLYAVVSEEDIATPRRFVVNGADRTVSIEGIEEDMPLADFRKAAVRIGAGNRIVASLIEPLPEQYRKCQEQGVEQGHLFNIRELAELYVDSEDSHELYDHHMYMLVSSELTDDMDYLTLMRKINAAPHPQGPVSERFGLEEAVNGWREVRELPPYMLGGVRFAFDYFMKDLLGDYPQERVSMIMLEKGTPLSETLEDKGFDIIGSLPPFDGGNAMRNYRTTPVALHRSNGVDTVVFTDFMATYAYSWPTEEGGKYEPQTAIDATFKFG